MLEENGRRANREELSAALATAVSCVSAPLKEMALSDAHFEAVYFSTNLEMEQMVQRVQAALASDVVFAQLKDCFLCQGGGAMRIGHRQLAMGLLIGALRTNDADGMAKTFAHIVETNEAEAMYVGAVAGIATEREVDLFSGVRLLPWEAVLPCTGKHLVDKIYRNTIGPAIVQPLALLGVRYRARPVFVSPEGLSQREVFQGAEYDASMQDAARCLTLAGPRALALVTNWHQFVFQGLGASMIVTSMMGNPPWHVGPLQRDEKLDYEDDLATIAAGYEAAPADLRKELAIPIERLGLAIGGTNIVDKAIDLGVSLESLLLHGLGSERGEMTYRLRVRGAALIGGDIDERKRNSALLGKLYGLRSAAVHSGHIRDAQATETFNAGAKLCSRLIRKILKLHAWPDFERLVLIGGD